ncbi:MAG TPA: hypothetical protein VN870_09240 [Streptosporangiaceae bacterium]|nr:hypothetical protein [Streptosporangiaceae bacterium]
MRFFCGFFCGCLAIVAGLYWAVLTPSGSCSTVLADQQQCASLTEMHNAAAVVAVAAAILCVITITWRKA